MEGSSVIRSGEEAGVIVLEPGGELEHADRDDLLEKEGEEDGREGGARAREEAAEEEEDDDANRLTILLRP